MTNPVEHMNKGGAWLARLFATAALLLVAGLIAADIVLVASKPPPEKSVAVPSSKTPPPTSRCNLTQDGMQICDILPPTFP